MSEEKLCRDCGKAIEETEQQEAYSLIDAKEREELCDFCFNGNWE